MLEAPLVFTDTETTGLNPDQHEAWEVAIIKRVPQGDRTVDVETVYQLRPDMVLADDVALEIGRFHDRFKVPPGASAAVISADGQHAEEITTNEFRRQVAGLTRNAVMVGSNTQFDHTFIRKALGRPEEVPWHYRPVNAIELAVGVLIERGIKIEFPWSSTGVSRRLGVEPPSKDEAHTALADARWARDVFDAVVGR